MKNIFNNRIVLMIISFLILIIIFSLLRYKKVEKNTAGTVGASFTENFDKTFKLVETSNINNKIQWWVSSGAYLFSEKGIGKTNQGKLSDNDIFRLSFNGTNPIDTDNGYYPQNIFRLVQKDLWQNYEQEVYFKIINNNLSMSANRNSSNGLFLFNRYIDENNLYYTGIRVDGYASIKKKINGEYFTMVYKPVFSGNKYDKNNNPNLLPLDTWIGLKSILINNIDGTVNIKLYLDKNKQGKWELVADTTDDGKAYGGNAITSQGNSGLRTDFMDVIFSSYKISSI